MERFLIFILMIFIFFTSCNKQNSRDYISSLDYTKTIYFNDEGNSHADILLSLNTDSSLILSIDFFYSDSDILYKGNWEKVSNNVLLHFDNTNYLEDIFELQRNKSENKNLELKYNTIIIPEHYSNLWIANVRCYRTQNITTSN